jgi:hypothetical protein
MEVWVVYAFIGFAGYFLVNFLMKFVASENPLLISLVLYGAATIAMLAIVAPKMDFSLSGRSVFIAILIGIFSVIATIFALKSISLSPNPGYSVAIYSANFVLLSLVSVFAFHSSLTFAKFMGILAVIIGLILLSI